MDNRTKYYVELSAKYGTEILIALLLSIIDKLIQDLTAKGASNE